MSCQLPLPNTSHTLRACTGGRCPGTQSGTLKSANYPANYPDKTDRTYILETDQGSTIKLTFEAFSLEASGLFGKCDHDYVKVIDSDDTTEVASICGDERPEPFTSQGNKLTIIFYTDESINKEGFEATWEKIPGSESGEFKSTNYPKNYETNLNITKLLVGPKGSRIEITITDFNIEKNYDFLTIYDSNGKELARYTGKLKKNELPKPLRSRTNIMTLNFYSDVIITKKGFRLTWKVI